MMEQGSWMTAKEVTLEEVANEPVDRGGSIYNEFIYVDISSIDRETKSIFGSKVIQIAQAPSRAKQVLKSGDVLVSMTRPNLNAVAIVLSEFDGAIGSTGFHVLRSISVEPKFLFYLVQTRRFIGEMCLCVQGALYPAVRPKDITSFVFPLPPIQEQHRIVAKIEELFSDLDKGIENLKTARAQLKVYRQALLKHAFEGKLTAAFSSCPWTKETLGVLLEFLTSGSRGWAQYYAAAGNLFIRAQNIKYDRLDLSDIAFVALPERTEGLRTRVSKGDLLITITGANVTKSALVEHDVGAAYVSQHVALCRPTNKILPRFLYWFVVAEAAGRKQLSNMAYGAGKPGLNLENIRAVLVPLPALSEQEKIVALIEDKLSIIDQLEVTITISLQQAEALRQSILKNAYSGQLVPQDPKDEPASALLARIKAQKAAHATKAKPA